MAAIAIKQGSTPAKNPDRSDDYVTLRPSFDIRITIYLHFNIFYNFRTLKSSQTDGFDDNQACEQWH